MSNRSYVWHDEEETHKNDDIINLPHYQSLTRPHMSMLARAAQFSPYAALTGYEAKVAETARLTNEKRELSDFEIDELNEKILYLEQLCNKAQAKKRQTGADEEFPYISVTYFVSDKNIHRDSQKKGGSYVKYEGKLRMVDIVNEVLIFVNASKSPISSLSKISIQDIVSIEYSR